MLLIGSLLLLGLSACATSPKILPDNTAQTPRSKQAPKAQIQHLSADQRSQLYYSILLAKVAEQKGFLGIARSNIDDALNKTQSSELASHSARLALYQKDYKAAQRSLKLWQQSNPNSSGPLKVAVLIAIHQAREEQAYELLSQLFDQHFANQASHSEQKELILSADEQFKQLIQMAFYQAPDNFELERQLQVFAHLLERYNLANPNHLPSAMTTEAFLKLKSRSPLSELDRIHQLLDASLALAPDFVGAINTKNQALGLLSQEKSSEYLTQLAKNQAFSKQQLSHLANIAYKQKNYQSAIIAFERILEAEPDNLEARFLLAGSHYGAANYEESLALFYQLSLEDYRKESSSFYCGDSAERVHDEIKSLSCYDMVPVGRFFIQARHRLAQIFADKGMFKQGAKSLETAQSLVDFNQRQLLLKYEINYLIEHQQFSLAKNRLDNAIQLEPHNNIIYYLQLLLADKTLSTPNFLKLSAKLRAQSPDLELRKEVIFTSIELLNQKGQEPLILDILNQEVAQYPKDTDIRYARAMSASLLKDFSQTERDLRYLLTLDPEHTNAQNALGYTLADQNRNLMEAQQLIEAAYYKEPDNSAVLDSMGWIQYRLGNLEKALFYIEKSYAKAKAAEIAAHYGEILWQLGRQQKAKNIWQKALQQEPNNHYILETLARFPEAHVSP